MGRAGDSCTLIPRALPFAPCGLCAFQRLDAIATKLTRPLCESVARHLSLLRVRPRYGTTRSGRPLYQLAWRRNAYNTLQIPMHRFGRCTGRDASCVGLHEHCPPPPPPFTKEVALAGRRKQAEAARLRGMRHRAERATRLLRGRNATRVQQR